ncbi:1852_t:CDS:2, partial [Scutellospora calospora]
IIPRPNEPSKHQINNYLAPIVDELVEFFKANDVPVARKISGHTSYAVKYYRCSKHAKYNNISKRNYYGSFDDMDEWFKEVDIFEYFEVAKQ